jgi:hypothetical protein
MKSDIFEHIVKQNLRKFSNNKNLRRPLYGEHTLFECAK